MAVRLFSEFTSQNGTRYTVQLHDAQFSGTPLVNNQLAENGFDLVYGDNDSERYDPIRGSRLSINYLITSNQQQNLLLDIVNSPEKRFQLVVYRNEVFYWCGQVTPDLIEIEDRDFPYYSQVVATDMLASLTDTMTGILPPGFFAINFKTELEVIMLALEYTGLNSYWSTDNSYLKTAIHWYPKNAGENDTANAHAARVLADGGQLPGTTQQLRAAIAAMRAVPLNETFSALVQAHRARVLADGGTMPGTDTQILAAYPDSVELREGTPGLDGYDPLAETYFNLLSLWDGFAQRPISELQLTPGQVISQVVERMGARIYLHEGSWCIDQPANFTNAAIITRVYYKTGTLKYQIYNEDRTQPSNSNINRRIGGGLTRFYRPLSAVSSEFAARLNVNLAQLRAPGGDVAVELLPAAPNYRLSVRGFANTERKENLPSIAFGIAVYRIEVFIDDLLGNFYYLNNGNPDATGNRFYWRPDQPQWSNTQSYFWVFDTSFTQSGITRNNLEFNIITPAIPDVGRLRYNAVFFGFVGPSGNYLNSTALSNQFIGGVQEEELYLLDDNAVDNNNIVYEAEDVNGKLSTYATELLLLGDSPLILSPGSLLNEGGPAGTYRPTEGWRRDPEAAYENIGFLHTREILEGQRQAIQKIDAWFIQNASAPISLRKRIERSGKGYIFNGVKLIASADEWNGTWYEVATISGGVIVNGRPKPPYDLSNIQIAAVTPGEDIQLQSSTAQQFAYQMLNHLSITTITADIAAGSVTSIPIEPLGEAFLQAGDKLIIIDQSNGQLHQLTLTAAVGATDTSLAVQAITLPAIQLGSSIATTGRRIARMIKKIDSGTIAGLVLTDDQIGAPLQPISINTQTGDIKTIGDFEVAEILAQDITAQEVLATTSIKAGTKATISAATGAIATDGGITAAGDVQAQDVNARDLVSSRDIKAGTKATISAATGNAEFIGNASASSLRGVDNLFVGTTDATKLTISGATGNANFAGNVSAVDISASADVVAQNVIKAGTKATISAATGNAHFLGDLTIDKDALLKGVLELTNLPLSFEEVNQVYLESDDKGAYYLKIKLPS